MTSDAPYLPPHLVGRAGDFKQEADGVSFADFSAARGLGPESARQTLSPASFDATFNPSYRRRNFEKSIMTQYGGPASGPSSAAEGLRDALVGKARDAYNWGTSSQGKSTATAGLIGGMLGAGAGTWQSLRNGEPVLGRAALYALLSAGLGAGAVAYGQNRHNAREAYLSKQANESYEDILRSIQNDPTLSPSDKLAATRAVMLLSPADSRELSTLAGMTAGGITGAVIMRFLRSKGLLPALLGGIMGAFFGKELAQSRGGFNAMGRPT